MLKIIFFGIISICFCMLITFFPVWAGDAPPVGAQLPEIKLSLPASEPDLVSIASYLEIPAEAGVFTVDQVKSKILMIEIIGVYCPRCHIQNPLFNKLYYSIKKDADMHERFKMIAVAAGATDKEVAFLKKQYRIPFPIIQDPKFEIHKTFNEPRTPCTMLVDNEQKIIYSHLGVINDMDAFYFKIRDLVK